MSDFRPEILPALATVGITPEAASDFAMSEPVLEDIAAVVKFLPEQAAMPDVEVDEDGTAVLRWFSGDMRNSFSLTFLGLGNVAGYLSSERMDPAWKLAISDEVNVLARLSNERVSALVRSSRQESAHTGSTHP